jgi:hypothetical protein
MMFRRCCVSDRSITRQSENKSTEKNDHDEIKMTWHCQACTYININDRAVQCHSCDTRRLNSNSAAAAIIDLTEICSPKLTAAADENDPQNHKSQSLCRRGDVMESNRSRRRRRLEQSTTISGGHNVLQSGTLSHSDGSVLPAMDTNPPSRPKAFQSLISSQCRGNAAVENTSGNKGGRGKDHDVTLDPDPSPRENPILSFGSDNYAGNVGDDHKPEVEIGNRSNSSNGMQPRQRFPERNTTNERQSDMYNPLKIHSPEALLKRANIILQQSFKHKSLRPLQETAIMNTLQRKSSIVVMATGGGKSLTYQLPALVGGSISTSIYADTSRVTIVVCPLIALMIDQVNNLLKRGIRTAVCLSSSHNAKTRQEILNRLQCDKRKAQKGGIKSQISPIQLLYCTPELIETDKFRAILTDLYESNRLYMFAIDEAHCLSTWGELGFHCLFLQRLQLLH